MCVNMVDISHFDPGYAIIESEYVFVILKREMSLFSSCRRCTYTISYMLLEQIGTYSRLTASRLTASSLTASRLSHTIRNDGVEIALYMYITFIYTF